MTLSDLLASQPDLATLRPLCLVFSTELCQRLVNVQSWYGDPRHVPSPVGLADGRWMLCADILSECGDGGLVHAGFSHLDAARFGEIEVLEIAEVEIAEPQPVRLEAEAMPEEEGTG